MEPYQRLAMEVIKSAVQDLELVNKRISRLLKKETNRDDGLNRAITDRNQIIRFFQDEEWCGFWCDVAGVNYGALMDRVRELIN